MTQGTAARRHARSVYKRNFLFIISDWLRTRSSFVVNKKEVDLGIWTSTWIFAFGTHGSARDKHDATKHMGAKHKQQRQAYSRVRQARHSVTNRVK